MSRIPATQSPAVPGSTDGGGRSTDRRAWVIDVDGCLVRTATGGGAGGTPMPRAVRFLEYLRARGERYVVCTNASQQTPHWYAEHLREMGLAVEDEAFVTAGSAAADHIARTHASGRILAVGGPGFLETLTGRGLDLLGPDRWQEAEAVVIGADDTYQTRWINAAALAVDGGAAFYTCVDVKWFHGGIGKSIASSSAMAAAVAWVTGVEPVILGKPSPALGQTLLRLLDAAPRDVTVLGDSLVEVELAHAMGSEAILLLSGATSAEEAAAIPAGKRPRHVLEDVEALFNLLAPEEKDHPHE
ncbi:HAD-IIA family hydrolase [Nonomuraea harbinensis]|uniref:HAD-IIA family hydrolase n=1 Tax=Nonomuraea harbinensis TaxID=1286938 RepID=A0ABW1CBI2_9ACTN|nr:HAD hydrolase-like protein [Nonomuraea harbinensis]